MFTPNINPKKRKLRLELPGYSNIEHLPKMLWKPLQLLMATAIECGKILDLEPMNWKEFYRVTHPDHVRYVRLTTHCNYNQRTNF